MLFCVQDTIVASWIKFKNGDQVMMRDMDILT